MTSSFILRSSSFTHATFVDCVVLTSVTILAALTTAAVAALSGHPKADA
jgi:hypothetical protein